MDCGESVSMPSKVFDGIVKLFLEFVALKVKHNIIRYQRNDAGKGGQAVFHSETEADEKHGQKQNDGNEIRQDRRLVALPDGHLYIDFLVDNEVFAFWAWHGEGLLGLFAHAACALGMAGSAGALCQYLDFQFVFGNLGYDTFVGDGFFVFHAAKILFFRDSTKNHYFCTLFR